MRSILVTVMMLLVVAALFTSVVTSSGGIRSQIETKGADAKSSIGALNVGGTSN